MVGMNTGHEVNTPATDDPTPLPAKSLGGGRDAPTPEVLLKAIAAHSGPWFPSNYAASTGTPRDTLDDPLGILRLAGLVRVGAWVRGVGQGYVVTAQGEAAVADPAVLKARAAAEPPTEVRDDPDPAKIEAAEKFQFKPFIIDLRPPLLTPVMVGINLLWFFVGLVVAMRLGLGGAAYLNGGNASVPALGRIGAVSGAALMSGDWWRLVTSCFVHIGWVHLLMNMLSLGMMGPVAEMMWGRGRLLVIYAVSGVAGSCLAMANRPEAMLAGASGAIWGVQMALVAWVMLFRAHLPSHQVADMYRRLTIVIVLNVGLSMLPTISWEGHLGGGIAGFVTAGLLNVARYGSRRQRGLAVLLIALAPVLCVGGLAVAMKYAGAWKPLRDRATALRVTARAVVFKPFLDELAPNVVHPVENEAWWLLQRDPARRKKDDVAAVRQKVVDLHDRATFALNRLDGPPAGDKAFDEYRERAKAFAVARALSFDALRVMIDANTRPEEGSWAGWSSLRRAADQLWASLR
jgi:rhomboid protease GluP